MADRTVEIESLSNIELLNLADANIKSRKNLGLPINYYQIPLGSGDINGKPCEWYLEYTRKLIFYKNSSGPVVTKKLILSKDEEDVYRNLLKYTNNTLIKKGG